MSGDRGDKGNLSSHLPCFGLTVSHFRRLIKNLASDGHKLTISLGVEAI